jgi:hypothetical protein
MPLAAIDDATQNAKSLRSAPRAPKRLRWSSALWSRVERGTAIAGVGYRLPIPHSIERRHGHPTKPA